jgi:hypothetical protein
MRERWFPIAAVEMVLGLVTLGDAIGPLGPVAGRAVVRPSKRAKRPSIERRATSTSPSGPGPALFERGPGGVFMFLHPPRWCC